jgi:integrase/recombinase XerD
MRPITYKFNSTINQELKRLESYLQAHKYHTDTIKNYINCTGIYLVWLDENSYMAQEMTYQLVIEFIQDIKQKYTISHTQRIIIAIRHYHESIQSEINPVTGIYIKGHRKSMINDLTDYAKLKDCYDTYETLSDRDKRNKIILGIFLYQAITTSEIDQLEPKYIRLTEGKIWIPGSGDSQSRTLDLEAAQLHELQEYLLIIRPRMLSQITAKRSGRKPKTIDPVITEKLFFSERGSASIKQSLHHAFLKVRKQYPTIKSPKSIRNTVIAEWLKTIDVRKVQYMAGHRYVSSTERYNVMNLQELKDSLNKYHPMQ